MQKRQQAHQSDFPFFWAAVEGEINVTSLLAEGACVHNFLWAPRGNRRVIGCNYHHICCYLQWQWRCTVIISGPQWYGLSAHCSSHTKSRERERENLAGWCKRTRLWPKIHLCLSLSLSMSLSDGSNQLCLCLALISSLSCHQGYHVTRESGCTVDTHASWHTRHERNWAKQKHWQSKHTA